MKDSQDNGDKVEILRFGFVRAYASKSLLNLTSLERRDFRESGPEIIQKYIDVCNNKDVYLKNLLTELKECLELIVKAIKHFWDKAKLIKYPHTPMEKAYDAFIKNASIEEKLKLTCLLQEVIFSEKTFFAGLQAGRIVDFVTSKAISGINVKGKDETPMWKNLQRSAKDYPCNVLIFIALRYLYAFLRDIENSVVDNKENEWGGEGFVKVIGLNVNFIKELINKAAIKIGTCDFRTLRLNPLVIKDAKVNCELISYTRVNNILNENRYLYIFQSSGLFIFYKLCEQIFKDYKVDSYEEFQNYRTYVMGLFEEKRRPMRYFGGPPREGFGDQNSSNEEIFYDAYDHRTDLMNTSKNDSTHTFYKSFYDNQTISEIKVTLYEERKSITNTSRSSAEEIKVKLGLIKKRNSSSVAKKGANTPFGGYEFKPVKSEVLRILGQYLKLNSYSSEPSISGSWNITLCIFDQKHHAGRMREVIRAVQGKTDLIEIAFVLQHEKNVFENFKEYKGKEKITERWDDYKVKNVPKDLQKSKFYKTICEALGVCEKNMV
ncbi:hypothetical protein FRA_34c06840 [Francisella sp. W12-1067]|nr:hypothetical protein FRA_34c06840 [Francisella sp. W12-1067]